MTIKRHNPGKILSTAVEHNGVVYLAGLTADDRSQDVKGQTVQILKKMDDAMAALGTDKTKLLSVNIWVSDIRLRDPMNEAWLAWMDPKNPPARACVESKMADPLVLVEIMATAAK